MGNSHKPHKIRHHSKKRGGANEENTEVDEMDMEAEPVKPVAVRKPVPAKPIANAPVADAPVAKGKCCPCPDENEGLLQKLNPKKKLGDLETGILNAHARVGNFRTTKTAELKDGLKGKVLGLTAKINETVGNNAPAPAPAPAAVEVAQAVEEEAQSGGRRRRRRTSKVKKGRKSKKRSKSKKGRKTKRTRKTKHY